MTSAECDRGHRSTSLCSNLRSRQFHEHVIECRRSHGEALDPERRGSERSPPGSVRRRPSGVLTMMLRPPPGQARALRSAQLPRGSGSIALDLGDNESWPTERFSSAGSPQPPTARSMMPTRSASASASSRYCVVRKMVMPSSRLSRRSPPRRCSARTGPAPWSARRGRELRDVDQGRSEVEPPLHSARIGADAPIDGVANVDQVEHCVIRSRTWAPSCRRDALGAAESSRPVWRSSSAVSCKATPIRSRTSWGWRATSCPATKATPRGPQERAEHPDGCRLPSSVGPQEAVDLGHVDTKRSRRSTATVEPNRRTRSVVEPSYQSQTAAV